MKLIYFIVIIKINAIFKIIYNTMECVQLVTKIYRKQIFFKTFYYI